MSMYMPMMLDITKKNVVIIGGGRVSYRKLKIFFQFTSYITVVSDIFSADIEEFSVLNRNIKLIRSEYMSEHLLSADIVIAATNSSSKNIEIYQDAKARGAMVNVIDNPELCDFIIPSILHQGDLSIAISTNGKSPAMAKKIRKELEQKYKSHYAYFIEVLGKIRALSLSSIDKERTRKQLFIELINSEVIELLDLGYEAEAKNKILDILHKYNLAMEL